MRKLTALTDGTPLNAECRFHLRGTLRIGLFPSLFLLECWNLSETDVFRLRNTKELSVMKTNWKLWGRAALIRAIRTFAEAALAYIGTGAVVLGDVNWLAALSAGAFGFVTAVLLALTGLPEAESPEDN